MKIIEITQEEIEIIEKYRKIKGELKQYFLDILKILANGTEESDK